MKDEKNGGDVRRLLRRVTNRAKSNRRQRSKSALGHLQYIHNERSIDDAVAKAAEIHKLSNDELHTNSSPDLEKQKRLALLSKLRNEQKSPVSNDGPTSSSRHASEKQAEFVQQHTEHAHRSPTLRSRAVGLEQVRLRNAHPRIVQQPKKSPSHRTAASSIAAIPRSYCGIGSRSESVLLFSGHSRHILLRQSRDRVASASSGFHSLSTGRSTLSDESNTSDSLSAAKSAEAYLGSSVSGHNPVMRQVVMRNRAANVMKCWQHPESNLTAEQKHSSVTDQENHLSSSLLREETCNAESERAELSTNVSPSYLSAATQLPFLRFKKADHLHNITPLSLSVQCGSDSDDLETVHETIFIPKHRLKSKRIWNTNTRSWEDAVEHCSTDSLSSNRTSPDGCNFPDVAFLSKNRDYRGIVFTRVDTAVKSSEPVHCKSTLQLANSQRNRWFFSEGDIQNAVSHSREQKNIDMLYQPTVRNVGIGASDKCDHILSNRHSVTGCSYNEKLVSSWREQIIQSFYPAKSCPEMTSFSNSVMPSHSIQTSDNVRRRRKMSRFVSNIRQTAPKSSERQRRVGRVNRRQKLSPPLFASWPGKGDVKGSILAYESSV